MRFLPVHPGALLVELDDLSQTLALLASLQAAPIEGIGEIVPGARTLLLAFDPQALTRSELAGRLTDRPLERNMAAPGPCIEIPVHYDGEDLAEVAGLLGIETAEVVRRHTGDDWCVAFTGFAPGFAYLSAYRSGRPANLNVPRRTTPRTRIPAGAVGLAGGFSGVYPKAGPGGWRIIGQTFTPMWDLHREHPALLRPGQRVRFVDAGARPAGRPAIVDVTAGASAETDATTPGDSARESRNGAALEIVATGIQAVLQDMGRPGLANQGIAASGAMDRASLRTANRLVGNAPGTACIEIVQGGFELICRGDVVVAVSGADGPLALTTAAGARWPLPRHAPLALGGGDRLTVAEPHAGVRSYLAVRGGFELAPVLGSRSFDTLAQIGPPPLAAGDRLPVRSVARGAVVLPACDARPAWPARHDTVTLDVTMGPRTDWFSPTAVERLTRQPWTVTPQSDRIGMRLTGDWPLERARTGELPSEGTVRGAIQVPPDGHPVLFLADHPLTGGYPVIACVAPWHQDLAGQVPIGARIRFNAVADFDPFVAQRRGPLLVNTP